MSEENPLVSVIVPVFNADPFLNQAVQSVRDQTYEKWELILVEDGSTDESPDIARDYARTYPDQIRYFEHAGRRNRGSSATRNTGIRKARGKYIAFLDADDFLMPDYLLNQVEIITRTKAAMVCEASVYWYSWQEHPKKKDNVKPVGAPQDRLYSPQELNLILYPLRVGAAPCMNGIIAAKEALVRHGGFEEEFKGMYDDQVFLSKMYYNEPVFISSLCNNYYRIRDDSLMSTVNDPDEYHRYRNLFLEWFKQYIERSGYINRDIHSLVRKQLFRYRYPRFHRYFYTLPDIFYKKFRKMLSKL